LRQRSMVAAGQQQPAEQAEHTPSMEVEDEHQQQQQQQQQRDPCGQQIDAQQPQAGIGLR
jgi:hypothetical protein